MKLGLNNLIFFLMVKSLIAQVNLEWVSRFNGSDNEWDVGGAVVVDDSGFVYVTGATFGWLTDFDFVTLKYNSNGDSIWRRVFSTANGFDGGLDIALDDSGNVYFTGVPISIKFNSSGEVLWIYENFAGFERIIIDNAGDIYLAGTGVVTSWTDYVVKKLNPSGELLWYRNYNGPADDIDRIRDAVLDNNSNLIVTGDSRGIETDYDYATIKYSPDGDTLWVRRFNGLGPSTPSDHAFAITVDDSDNVYVTGWSDGLNDRPQCVTIKYNPVGDLIWNHRFPNGGTVEYAGYDIMYLHGFIYVAARAHFSNDILLKYDLDGNLIWTRVFVTVNVDTHNKILASDKLGNIYMTSGGGVSPGSDYIVLKYNPDGDLLWEYRYRAISNASSRGYALYVDSSLYVYLTGEATGAGTNFDIVTLKLSQDTTTSVQEIDLAPSEFKLFPAYPNPFNSSTNISFALPYSTNIDLKIYNILGEEITTMISDYLEAGKHKLHWAAGDLPSGIYFYTLTSGDFMATKKLVLLK